MLDYTNHKEFTNLFSHPHTNPSQFYSYGMDEYVTKNVVMDFKKGFEFLVDFCSNFIIIGIEFTLLVVKNVATVVFDVIDNLLTLKVDYKDGFYMYFMAIMFVVVCCLLHLNFEMNAKMKSYMIIQEKIHIIEKILEAKENDENDENNEKYFGNGRYSKRDRVPTKKFN